MDDAAERPLGWTTLDERLAGIAKLADALTDFLPGEGWSLAYGIKMVAEDKWTLAEAHEFIDGRES